MPKRLRQYDLNDATYRVYTLVRGVRRRADQPRVGVMFFGKVPPRGFQEKPAARYLLPTDLLANSPAPWGLREGDGDAPPSLDTLVGEPAGSPLLRSAPRPDDPSRPDTPPPTTAAATLASARAGVPAAPVPGAGGPDFRAPDRMPEDRRVSPRVQLFVNFTIQLVDEWGAVLQEELTVADNISRGGARVMTSLGFHAGDVLLLQEAGGGFATRAEVRATTKVQPTVDRLHLRFLDRQAPARLMRQ